MADDDEKPHDWDPDREKRQTDPEALARSFVRAAADEQAKIDKEKAGRVQSRSAYLCPAPPLLDLQVGLHKITNGYLVLWGLAPVGYPADRSHTQEVFAVDATEVHAVVLRLLREFFEGKLPAAGYGTPPGPFIGGMGPVGE